MWGRLRFRRLKLLLIALCAFSVLTLMMRRHGGHPTRGTPIPRLAKMEKPWRYSLATLDLWASNNEVQILEEAALTAMEEALVVEDMTSEEAHTLEAAPEPKEVAPDPKEVAPEPEEVVLEQKDAAPEPKEAAPEPKEAAPVPKEAAPVPKEAAPGPKEVAPGPKDVAPDPKEAAPELKEAAPVPKEAAPVPKEAAPVPKEAAPVPKEAAPVPKEAAPKPKEAAPVPKEAALGPKEVAPGPKDAALGPKEVAPGPKDAAPEPKNPVQVPKEVAPEPKEAAPEPKEAAPEPKEAAPEPKEAAPEPKEVAPEPKETAPKPKDPVPKEAAPAVKQEALARTPKRPTSPKVKTTKPKAAPKAIVTAAAQGQKRTTRVHRLNIIPTDLNPSYIGDEYVQEENPFLTTGCPVSIGKRFVASDFRQFYLPKIPVFQWAKHATPEEFQRLRWYNGCFGWNVSAWEDTKEMLSLLNTSANGYMFSDWNRNRTSGNPCIRCAVVGNGGILNGSKMGREIDKHDYVFRVNGAILKGFEADVGTRTSFYVFSTNTMMNSLDAYGNDGFLQIPGSENTSYVFLPDNDRDYYMMKAVLTRRAVDKGSDRGCRPSEFFGENYTTEQFKMFHPDFLRYVRNRFLLSDSLREKQRDIYRPTTGAAMMFAAMHTCDEVDAYGFITPDYEKYSDHYYDKTKKKVYFYSNHDFLIEMVLWQRLHQQGIINLYSRP